MSHQGRVKSNHLYKGINTWWWSRQCNQNFRWPFLGTWSKQSWPTGRQNSITKVRFSSLIVLLSQCMMAITTT